MYTAEIFVFFQTNQMKNNDTSRNQKKNCVLFVNLFPLMVFVRERINKFNCFINEIFARKIVF